MLVVQLINIDNSLDFIISSNHQSPLNLSIQPHFSLTLLVQWHVPQKQGSDCPLKGLANLPEG
jgi:hypothetical protein